MLAIAKEVVTSLKSTGVSAALVDLFWLRPYDRDLVHGMIQKTKKFVILDESYIHAGASGYLLNEIPANLLGKFLKTFALPPEPIHHGERYQILDHYHLDAKGITTEINRLFSN
jgi:1-deoxy-D-xylulose-5-phosphate synthase